jgi:Mor family transcriptional regulator
MKKSHFKSKGPELLTDMFDHITAILKKQLPPDLQANADNIAQEITDHMAAHWGGQNVYFPMGANLNSHRLAQKIYKEFDGTNVPLLASTYKMSVQWIYALIKQIKEEELEKRQGKLFEDPASEV